MLILRGAAILAALGLWVYSVYDVTRSEARSVRNFHKVLWLMLVVFVPTIGSVVWLLFGRPQPVGASLFSSTPSAPPPDDSPEFLARLDEEIRRRRRQAHREPPPPAPSGDVDIEQEIRRLEDELRRRSERDRPDGEGPSVE